ncbi:hypothetical protein [Streptomyces sp. HNM0574]|uniref:hypothetical protein n=1 Tax=Streptomyces sp. HNM0574 TaxID=2714954 RepID=UPI003217ED71
MAERRDGARVLACGRGARPGHLAEEVRWVRADVSRAADAEAERAFGPVSLLVNNAGCRSRRPSRTPPTSTGTR